MVRCWRDYGSRTHELDEHEGLRGSGRRSVIPDVHGRELYCCMCVLFKAALNLSAPVICLTFYNSRLEVANDVFNGVGTSGPVILPRCTRSAAWRHAVGSPGTIAACLHILQALTVLPTRTSCRPMMALTSGALETCVRALGTYEPSCTGRPARLFLMFGACGQQGTAGCVVAQSPPHKEA
jgi:hypothetical protein